MGEKRKSFVGILNEFLILYILWSSVFKVGFHIIFMRYKKCGTAVETRGYSQCNLYFAEVPLNFCWTRSFSLKVKKASITLQKEKQV